MSEEHTPYYSTRVRIADITSPKDFVGLKERTIEITIGNSANAIVYRDPQDLADTREKDVKGLLMAAFEATDQVAELRGFKFLDHVEEKA